MGRKINMFLSIGALFPFFIILLIVSVIEFRNLLLLVPVIILFLLSIFINIYAVKVVMGKEKFNPKLMKIKTINKMKKGEGFLSVLSVFLSLIPFLNALPSLTPIDVLIIVLATSFTLIMIYTFYEDEGSLSQLLFIRVLFKSFYVARTDTDSTVYILSKEKLQANSKINAYHVIDDIYLFAYRTNN
jgi:hypothetical protein